MKRMASAEAVRATVEAARAAGPREWEGRRALITGLRGFTGSYLARELGWAAHTTLEQLCQMMVDADLRRNELGFSF